MDIKCKICGEPWDMDSIHEAIDEEFAPLKHKNQKQYEEMYYNPMKERFFKDGCKAFGSKCNTTVNENAELWEVAYEVFGDDLDGVATIMEDMGY